MLGLVMVGMENVPGMRLAPETYEEESRTSSTLVHDESKTLGSEGKTYWSWRSRTTLDRASEY